MVEMDRPEYEVEVYIGPGFDIWLHSYFLCGLILLETEGLIRLRLLSGGQREWASGFQQAGYPLFVIRCTSCRNGATRRICFDPRDQSDVWQARALDAVDVYFKRSFFGPDAEQLAIHHRAKVLPISPMFATWVRHGWRWEQRILVDYIKSCIRGNLLVIPSESCHEPHGMLRGARPGRGKGLGGARS